MIDLFAAFKTAWDANSTLTAAFTGGIHAGSATDSTSPPFVCVFGLGAPREFAYGSGKDHSENSLDFAVVAQGFEACRQKMKTFIAQWDAITVTTASGTCFAFFRDTDPMPDSTREPEGQDENGNDVWVWRVTYSYLVQS